MPSGDVLLPNDYSSSAQIENGCLSPATDEPDLASGEPGSARQQEYEEELTTLRRQLHEY